MSEKDLVPILLSRKSILTGIWRDRVMHLRESDLDAYEAGECLAQTAFPYLSAEDREFIMTGITPEEWAQYMGSEEAEA